VNRLRAVFDGDSRDLDRSDQFRTESGGLCDCPAGEIEVTINPSLLPASRATATISISSPNASGSTTVRVQVFADFEVAAPGTSRAQ
jgi:hypothetical protein